MVCGALEVLKKVGNMAYILILPDQMKIHPTFHVSFLKPYHEDPDSDRKQTKMALPVILKEFEHEVERILTHKIYLLKWRGLLESEAMWEKA